MIFEGNFVNLQWIKMEGMKGALMCQLTVTSLQIILVTFSDLQQSNLG